MVLYNCFICNFSTNKTTNYERHLKTKKHLRNVNNNKQFEKESNNVSKNDEKNVLKMFSHQSSIIKNTNSPKMQQNATKCNTKTENCFFCNLDSFIIFSKDITISPRIIFDVFLVTNLSSFCGKDNTLVDLLIFLYLLLIFLIPLLSVNKTDK